MKNQLGKPLLGAAVIFAAATLWSGSALAISTGQFTEMCQAKVGLRSAAAARGGAGYAFDDGATPRVCVLGPVPATWDATLQATIHAILGQPHQGNNLYMLNPCAGTGERYQGSFPKCNSVGQDPHTYAVTPIGQQTEAELINWVNQQINLNFH